MRYTDEWRYAAAAGLLALASSGMAHDHGVLGADSGGSGGPTPVGTLSNQIWRMQEHNAEASDFVIYEHEFMIDGTRLNYAGEDHVKQIAARIRGGHGFPVLVERSRHTVWKSDTYRFPVHLNPKLDMLRREVVVQALLRMGIENAEEAVVVSPALSDGLTSPEAERAYLRGINPYYGLGGFGGRGGRFAGGFGF